MFVKVMSETLLVPFFSGRGVLMQKLKADFGLLFISFDVNIFELIEHLAW